MRKGTFFPENGSCASSPAEYQPARQPVIMASGHGEDAVEKGKSLRDAEDRWSKTRLRISSWASFP